VAAALAGLTDAKQIGACFDGAPPSPEHRLREGYKVVRMLVDADPVADPTSATLLRASHWPRVSTHAITPGVGDLSL
jgi:hypothetical protein